MKKPTQASVTDLPCQCCYLERKAADARFPVRFDAQEGQYYFDLRLQAGTTLSLVVYHCPMCGGVASKANLEDAFAVVPDDEIVRLDAKIRDFRTAQEVVHSLGVPDRDEIVNLAIDFPLVRPQTGEPEPGPVRVLTYEQLSETADVQFMIYSNGEVERVISPKYIAPPVA